MTRTRSRGSAYALLLAICVLSRLAIFVYLWRTDPGTDVARYYRYSRGVALEQLEYPPLALVFIASPRPLASLLRELAPAGQRPDDAHLYTYAYRLELLAIDLASFGLLLSMVARLRPAEPYARQIARGLGYILLGFLQWAVLYDRFDLVVSALLLGSFNLLIGRRTYLWSFLVLAGAINLKLFPLVLVPLWVCGSLPASLITARRADLTQAGRLAFERSAVMTALTAAVFLPLLWRPGPATSLHFIGYHVERGSEVGSLYSYAQLLLAAFGVPTSWISSHNSIEIQSAASLVLVALFPFLAAAVFLLTYWWIFRLLFRAPADAAPALDDTPSTLAAAHPSEFAGFAALLLIVFMVTSKVFSPQYLIWIVPLLPLAPLGRRATLLWGGGAAVLATSLTYPIFWGRIQRPGGLTRIALPLFTLRNAILAFVLWELTSQLSARFSSHAQPAPVRQPPSGDPIGATQLRDRVPR